MEENRHTIESLLGEATEFGKTSFELMKLKMLDKTSDFASACISRSIVYLLLLTFVLFLSIGASFWLGDVLGKLYYGFFAVAGFYGLVMFVLRVFMFNWLKRVMGNYFIKKILK